MEFLFAVTVGEPNEWNLRLFPVGSTEPLFELSFTSRADCEQAIEMIREAPVRYARSSRPVVRGSARERMPRAEPDA